MPRRRRRIGDSAAVVHRTIGLATPTDRKRALVADLCKLLGHQLTPPAQDEPSALLEAKASEADSNDWPHLSPRMRQTLHGLLDGDSEKQIAMKLSLSTHTVHVYVKAIYKGFAVNSRGELLSRVLKRSTHRQTTPAPSRAASPI